MTMNLLPSQATDVAKVAAALRSLGVGKGDVVCGFMPNAYETIVSALGTAAIGAAWSSASLDFGPGGVLDRFKQVKPKVIFTVNATTYKRKLFDLRRKVDEIVSELPTLEKVILINYKSALPVNLSDYKCKEKLAMYEDFVANFSGAKPSYERVPFGHPLFVMFSSGTTGVPKAMVHTVGGTLLKHLEEHLIQNDARQQDSMFFYTTCGWMMWNWSISFLAFGSRLILYDESPLEPDHYVIPKIISDSKATIIGMGAQLYDRFEKIDAKRNLCKEFGLGAVRLVLSTGSPLKEAIFRYINAKLAPGAVIGSISGGTDIIGCFMGATLSKSVIPGQCTVPYLGHEIKSFNPRGEAIQDQQGELVCLTPFPSMPSHFLNDTDGSRYSKAYFERFPGVWAHGDYCIIDSATGGITMLGRSDATLNRGGVRMGTAEIYNVVDTFAEIADSIVVGRQIPQEKDEEILLFVKLSPGSVLDDHLRLAICKTIRERQSPRHVPNKIIPIADIPYTNSGKKLKEDELKELFKTHGEVAECYLSGKGFAFVNMDTRAHAESAKEALDGTQHRGRTLRVRFAMHGAAVRVKELSHTVSNEMLYNVFSNFGEVERAIHVVDEKGRPTGEGIIEFERKPAANEAIAQIRDKVFLITACPKPLVAEPVEAKDEDDGLFERNVPRTPQLQKEREVGPRFPPQNTFEFAYGQKWKELYEVEKQRRALLEDELREGRKRLEADMEIAYQDYQAQMLREDLQRRQQELERLEAARRERMSNMGPPSINMGRGGPPPHMVPPPFQSQQQPNPFSGGPPGPFGVPSLAVPPPTHHHQQQHPQHQQQQFAPPPQQGNPNGPRPNVIEGVQRLLQLFKNDDGRGAGPGNQQNMQQNHPGGAFNNYQPRYGASGDHYGGGSDAFGNQPPMKRERR
ncbi:unnamed protein product, partial [Mesorhabditis spiculigera]